MEMLMSAAALLIALGVLVYLASRRGEAAVFRGIESLEAGLARLGQAQEVIRQEIQRGRETSVRQLGEAELGIRDEIGRAHRVLVEVKALEHGRTGQLERATDSLRRLEAVVAGSASRGSAGENILARALAQLPAELLEVNVSFGGKVVEYALRLPDGRLLPIDSKWTSATALGDLADLTDAGQRRTQMEQICRDLRGRAREMGKYLDPQRTLSLGLLAVPDAVFLAVPEVHGEAYRQGVLVVPYSLVLPYVLALYRLVLRFGGGASDEPLAEQLRLLEESLRRIDEEIEGRLSRSLVQLGNARDALREHLRQAHGVVARVGGAHRGQAGQSGPPTSGPRATVPEMDPRQGAD